MKYKVVLTDKRHTSYYIEKEVLQQIDAELIEGDFSDEDGLIAACADADALLVDMAVCTQRVVESLKKCKIISRYGVGYDNVDVAACSNKGIVVTNVPDYCDYDVSDFALGHILACMRGIAYRDRMVRQGKWNIQLQHSHRMKDRTLAIIGFGRIGRCLAKKLAGFELNRLMVCDPNVSAEKIAEYGAEKVDFDTALSQADIVSIHVPLNDTTRDMFDERAFSIMKPNAILVNTARGPIVNADALYSALKDNKIAFAGIDTHTQEPLQKDNRFFELDNCLLTDHTGYNTIESTISLKTKAAENVVAVLSGNMPPNAINSTALKQ